jgi:hypothetical protein
MRSKYSSFYQNIQFNGSRQFVVVIEIEICWDIPAQVQILPTTQSPDIQGLVKIL